MAKLERILRGSTTMTWRGRTWILSAAVALALLGVSTGAVAQFSAVDSDPMANNNHIYTGGSDTAVSDYTIYSVGITKGGAGTGTDNAMLTVWAATDDDTQPIASVSWGTTPLSIVCNQDHLGYGPGPLVVIYRLFAPTIGTNDLKVTLASGKSARIRVAVMNFFNVNQGGGSSTFGPCNNQDQNTSAVNQVVGNGSAAQSDGSVVFGGTACVTPTGTQTITTQTTGGYSYSFQRWNEGDPTLFRVAGATKAQPEAVSYTTNLGFKVAVIATPFSFSAVEIKPAGSPTAVKFIDGFEATPSRGGVALRWHSGGEVSNLGFVVWRERDGVREKATPSLLAGSALLAGSRTHLAAGMPYSWVDPLGTADGSTSYWLESISTNGTSEFHGPFFPSAAATKAPNSDPQSFLLSELGRVGQESPGEPGVSPADMRQMVAGLGSILLGGTGSVKQASNQQETAAASGSANARVEAVKAQDTQWILASHDGAKIFVDRLGWQRVTRAALTAAGWDPGSSTRNLQLFTGGVEQPILVNDGGGKFDPQDTIEFWGVPQDTPWTGSRVYWLTTNGNGSNLRVTTSAAPGPHGSAPPSFPFTVERKDRTIYIAALTNNGDEPNFFGSVVSSTQLDLGLILPNLGAATASTYPLVVSLQGIVDKVTHQVRVLLNGKIAGTMTFGAWDRGVQTFQIPASWLTAGNNVVSLTSFGGDLDVSLVDYIRLTYPHTFTADQGALLFPTSPGTPVTVRGFTSAKIRVVDVTDPLHVQELKTTVSTPASGEFAVAVVAPAAGSAARQLFAFSDDRVVLPARVSSNQPSQLHEGVQVGHHQVTHYIITHSSFAKALAPLAAFRNTDGLVSAVIDVEDIFDEYSFGEKTPYAIRSFLQDLDTNSSNYVLLVGNASSDPRNYSGLGDSDFVPTKLIPTVSMKTASDEWFVETAANSKKETFSIGRLSVRTAAEATAVVAKILGWEKGRSTPATWRSNVLLVSDVNDPPDVNTFKFETAISTLSGDVPKGYTKTSILTGGLTVSDAHSQIVSAMNAGQFLVTFAGHGSEATWSSRHIFDTADASSLSNGSKLPIFLTLDCLNGAFHDVYQESLGEYLLRNPGGGAVAVFASTGLTEPEPQLPLGEAFYASLLSTARGTLRIGDAVNAAQGAATNLDVRRTWNLLGDPAMKIR